MTQETPPPAMGFPGSSPTTTWTPPPAPAVPFVQRLTDSLAARAIVVSLVGGFLAQLLLFGQRPGINWPIWIAVVIAAAAITRRPAARIDRADTWLPIGALAFAAFMALRDDPGLFTFDLLASSALTLASVVAIGGLAVTRNTWQTIGRLGGSAVVMFWAGAPRMLHGFRPLLEVLPAFGGSSTSRRVARGLLLALPLVVTFVLLFAAADAVFQNLLRSTFDFRLDLSDWVGRFVFGLAAAWFLGGTLVAGWLTRDRFPQHEVAEAGTDRHRPLSSVEALTVVAVLDALFAIFVIIQAAYLFPGADPLSASGLTYAEYARRGFFELVVVALLSGTVILALDWLVDRATRSFRLATAGLALMTGIVLISAAVRLNIYQQVYGWTELRFYVLAAIVMLAFGVIATVAAIAACRVGAVPKLVLAAGLVIAFACNAIGPQAFVTTRNVERAANPTLVPADGFTGLDTGYIATLSADVVPSLVQSLNQLPPEARDQVVVLLRRTALALRADATGSNWQSWNLSRQRALDALVAAEF